MNCTIAIDFTGTLWYSYIYSSRFNIFFLDKASNGDPRQTNSLHFMGPTPTLYEQTLLSVVTIIQDYDSDKQFPVLGFGAKVPPQGALSHEFFVNMMANPYCAGVGGYYY